MHTHKMKNSARIQVKIFPYIPAPLEGESDHGAPYIPTPEEISEKCERIRRGWSSNNEQSRTVQQRPDAVEVRVVET